MKTKTEHPVSPGEAFPPTKFKVGDIITLHSDYYEVSNHHNKMIGVNYIVKETKFSNVGNMFAEIVYLEPKAGVKNPYLAEYFKKIEDDS